jgi:hypothetical protein
VKGPYWQDNDKPRTVNINCLGVGLLDFDLDPDMKERLIEEGAKAFGEKFGMEKSEEPRKDEVKKLLSLTAEPSPTTPPLATSTWMPPIVVDNPKTSVALGAAAVIGIGAVVYAKQEDIGEKCVLF